MFRIELKFMSSHILKNYDFDFGDLKDSVIKMGNAALSALEKAVEGLLESDRDKCYYVIDGC